MFGDASVYALTLYVMDRGAAARARAALFKGSLMGMLGVAVLVQAVGRTMAGSVADASAMGIVGFLALVANVACLLLLLRHRADDLNMRSTWLCSRNDIAANLGVLAAAALVAVFQASWPDVAVGTLVAALFLRSAVSVLREGWSDLRMAKAVASV
jgi:Co/Zn/Cd efflux system component